MIRMLFSCQAFKRIRGQLMRSPTVNTILNYSVDIYFFHIAKMMKIPSSCFLLHGWKCLVKPGKFQINPNVICH